MSLPRWCRAPCAAAALLMLAAPAQAAADCRADVDACVRSLVAETLVFAEACSALFPSIRAPMAAAVQAWPVLALPIPRLVEATDPQGALQRSLREQVAPALAHAPADEAQIECESRYALLTSRPPRLRGDTARVPPDVLLRYIR